MSYLHYGRETSLAMSSQKAKNMHQGLIEMLSLTNGISVQSSSVSGMAPMSRRSAVPELFVDVVPFSGGGYFNQTSCGELSIVMFLHGETRNNEHLCPAVQSEFGSACGCSDTTPPICNIECSVAGHVFNPKRRVTVFNPKTRWTGWYCGGDTSIDAYRAVGILYRRDVNCTCRSMLYTPL